MTAPLTDYTVQTWQGHARPLPDIDGMSIDGARYIARVHLALGYTVRLWANGVDYCEVYSPEHGFRSGTFAETTYITVRRGDHA